MVDRSRLDDYFKIFDGVCSIRCLSSNLMNSCKGCLFEGCISCGKFSYEKVTDVEFEEIKKIIDKKVLTNQK